ncbi:MAG: homoserine dehydrogenase [Lachnospiraceae bacterium]|nr:homoserine dehydrogenase [Lachnospiraceae bacterium]
MKIGLLGHGTIGVGVDHIVKEQPEMEVTKILSLVVDEEMKGRTAENIDDIVNDETIDTVVEVMGGVHPAYEFLTLAMNHGKNAVTANKAVVAAYYKELAKTAEENHVSFRSTAAVGGSIPWLFNLERFKRADHVRSVFGIMNGTTNYILNEMTTKGVSFDHALQEATRLGYAEKDPSADIDGPDVRRKLLISSNVAYDIVLHEEDIPTYGIRYVSEEDIRFASSIRAVLKLTAFSRPVGTGEAEAYVMPAFIPTDRTEAHIASNYNIISYEGAFSGRQTYMGEGAGRYPTAYNVVEDLYDVLFFRAPFYQKVFNEGKVRNDSLVSRFYVRSGETVTITDPIPFPEAEKLVLPGTFIARLPEES